MTEGPAQTTAHDETHSRVTKEAPEALSTPLLWTYGGQASYHKFLHTKVL